MTDGSADSGTMQALLLRGVGDLRYETVSRPIASEEEVLVRVACCGVCGSDIPRIFGKGTYSYPTICGHEFSGTVESCGPGVEDLTLGDRVTVFPLIWCGRCSACERGKYVQCHDYSYLGSRRDGAFAEFVAVPRRNVIRLPEGVSLEEAAMTEPAAVALHALRRAGGCSIGDTVAIFGAGPIGSIVAQWARSMGASRIILFDILPEKLTLAHRLGFSSAFNSREQDPIRIIHSMTRGEGAHLCIEAAGVPQTLTQALETARRGGRVVVLGNPSAPIALPVSVLSKVMRREVNMFGTWNSDYSATGGDDDWGAATEAMASKTVDLLSLITHRFPLSKAVDAILMMKEQREFFSKVLIYPTTEESLI